jgi:uncharacterized membrane protein
VNSNRKFLKIVALLAVTGLFVALYVFVAHSLGYRLFCPFATGCDAVQNSPYAVFFGIPVALFGILGFAAYIVLSLAGLKANPEARWFWYALLALSGIEFCLTFSMAYLQIAVIHAVCSWCMLSAAITAALTVVIVYAFWSAYGTGRSRL